MRTKPPSSQRLTLFVLALCVWLVWPAQALANALVRFIHAVPGVGAATIDVTTASGEQSFGSVSFGQVTPFRSIRAGSFGWKVTAGGKVLASGRSTVGDGVYDIAILVKMPGMGTTLGIYRAAGASGKTTLVRVIHAAPELGAPMFMLDHGTLANRLSYGRATPYYGIEPGGYTFSAMKPWLMKPGDPTIVDDRGVRFSPGVAYSQIVIGSRGQMVRVVRVVDRGAPLTRPAMLTTPAKSSMMGSEMMDPAMAGGHYEVRSGDSLWSIARRCVGHSASNSDVEKMMWVLWRRNARRIGTGDPNVIFPGQRLRIPV